MLITGVSGLLGGNLAYCLKDHYDILGIYHAHEVHIDGIRTQQQDLTKAEDAREMIEGFDPEIVIHSSAQADVDACELDQEACEKLNVQATRHMVNALAGRNVQYIFISTDLVYDGTKGHYAETDKVNPLSFYARTKREAELESLKIKNAFICRTNFYGFNIQAKQSLGEWAIHELSQKNKVKGFSDCFFSGIYTFTLADLLHEAIQKNLSGIYHCACRDSISKLEFVFKIADRLGLDKSLVEPISVDEFPFKAMRSKRLSLKTDKLANDLSQTIPTMDEALERFLNDYKQGVPGIIKAQAQGSTRNIYPASLDFIPYGRQGIDEDDIAAVVKVLKSASITQGPKICEFESALCKATGASSAVVVNSGTSALHIACLAAEIGPGDEVITSPNTFVASANCVVYCGGRPVFADIDLKTYNIDPAEIEKKINQRTKAIIPVHFAGQSCDMEPIKRIVSSAEKKYGHRIFIIEDACHALGSVYKGAKVGSCAYSDMAVMSFHPVKHVTTGEGGCVLTNNQKLRRKLSYFRSHGITSDPEEFCYKGNAFDEEPGHGRESLRRTWYYEQNCLGYNYRITEIQCALGISQLKKLDKFRRRRREIVNRYNEAFRDMEEVTTPFEDSSCDSNFHLYVLHLNFEKIGLTRARLMDELRSKRIITQVHYIPVHTQPFYQKNFKTQWGDCPHAEQYYEGCLSIPLFAAMSDQDVEGVINCIKELAGLRVVYER